MGLPGTGKTTLANAIYNLRPTIQWFNADKVRNESNDWDFSEEGRLRQAHRMSDLATSSTATVVLIDMVCPLPAMREIISPDRIVWVDTIKSGRFADTNAAFVPPAEYDFKVTTMDAALWANLIVNSLVID